MKKLYFIPLLFFMACLSDIAYQKKIIGNYYLLAVNDKRDISVSLKLESGDYIGRVSNVDAYAIVDSLLLIRSDNQKKYYILNMAKDHDYAKVEDIVVGPLDSVAFADKWLNNREIKFIPALE